MPADLLRDRSGTPPFVQPYLRALNRIQDERVMEPEALVNRAITLLHDMAGAGQEDDVSSFAYGPTGILGTHTHYFDGFAILLSLPLGTAVAARAGRGGRSEIRFEGGDRAWSFSLADKAEDHDDRPAWVGVVEDVFRRLTPDLEAVRVAVSTTVLPQCADAYVVALAVAAAGAASRLGAPASSDQERVGILRQIIERRTGLPFGSAYIVAAMHGHTGRYLLVDGLTLEHLPVEAPPEAEIGWGLMYSQTARPPQSAFFQERKEWIDEALIHLKRKAYMDLDSFRELEHKDLQRALSALPGRFKPGVRHLVTENRRVQKVVAALRRGDWQLLGAMLLMSHASHRNDWKSSFAEADFIVDRAEEMSIEGMYGASLTSRGGSVLVCGQPFVVPQFFERIAAQYEERFEEQPVGMLLPDQAS